MEMSEIENLDLVIGQTISEISKNIDGSYVIHLGNGKSLELTALCGYEFGDVCISVNDIGD